MTRGFVTRGVPVVLAVAFLAGCGGSESERDPAVARQEFLAAGDAICADAQVEAAGLARRAQEIQAQGGTESEQIELAAELWADQLEFAERFRDRLADLDVPPGDEARVDQFLATIDEGIVAGRDIKARLDDGESVPPELVQTYGQIAARGNTLAQAYGFQVCGRTSS